jgi:hypothetical protein
MMRNKEKPFGPLPEICDNLMAGFSYRGAAKSAGISEKSFWNYMRRSRSGDEEMTLDFIGERVFFHEAVSDARRIMLHNVRSEFEKRSYLGHDEIVYFQGNVSWQVEPKCVGLDEDTRELLGYRRDGLREVNGEVVPNVIHHMPPVAAALRVLEMAFPSEYVPQSKSAVTQTTTVNGLVGIAFAKPVTGPPSIPPAPVPPPMLEVLPDPSLAELLGEEPAPAVAEPAEFDSPDPAPIVAPTGPEPVMIAEPTPPEYRPSGPNPLIQPRNGRPLSPLERDLLSRLPDKVDRK